MPLTCSVCGLLSQQLDKCSICQTELTTLPAVAVPEVCPLEAELSLQLSPAQRSALKSPRDSVTLEANGRGWRVHWLSPTAWNHWRPAVLHRLSCRAVALPSCRVVETATGTWLIAEASLPRPLPWPQATGASLEQIRQLVETVDLLAQALESLHQQGLLWLSFDPNQLEWVSETPPRLRFTNLDLQVFPTGRLPNAVPVLTAFAAPELWRQDADALTPRTDVFHLALFAYYWLAGLLPSGFPGQGLASFQFDMPPLRTLAPLVPPRLATVLQRGLAREAMQRPTSPGELAADLRQALAKAEQRLTSTADIAWEVGWHTRAGQAKEALRRTNEDHVLVRGFTNPDRVLMVVADGISQCDVGNGALASRMTCLVLENSFTAESNAASFATELTAACRHGSETILRWALEQGYGPMLEMGRSLMGTTLTAGWLEGNELQVGNLGDSRAYLIEADHVEQLTVDGDLKSALLALRRPPEEVRGVGPLGRALRECVGGCLRSAEGQLVIPDQHCQPTLSRWRLLPGDVVVLCTDGLVEEEVFLDPAQLADLVRDNLELNAEEIAFILAEAADQCQRSPSALEPDGFGDNISVVVLKVMEMPPARDADEHSSQ
jgi:serine/threonine protein phosphatase PrpC